jgi:hypothetical protein
MTPVLLAEFCTRDLVNTGDYFALGRDFRSIPLTLVGLLVCGHTTYFKTVAPRCQATHSSFKQNVLRILSEMLIGYWEERLIM